MSGKRVNVSLASSVRASGRSASPACRQGQQSEARSVEKNFPIRCLTLSLIFSAARGREVGETGAGAEQPQPPNSAGVEASRESVIEDEGSSPRRIRTFNKPVNSRLLYH